VHCLLATQVYATLIGNAIRLHNFQVPFGATHNVPHKMQDCIRQQLYLLFGVSSVGQDNNKWTVLFINYNNYMLSAMYKVMSP